MSQFTTATTVGSQAMAIDSHDNLYCTVGYEVDKITPSGALSFFGTTGNGRDLLGGIAVDPAGNLYVTDYEPSNSSIGVFSPAGSYQTALSLPSLSGLGRIAIAPTVVPEPTIMLLSFASLAILGHRANRSRRR